MRNNEDIFVYLKEMENNRSHRIGRFKIERLLAKGSQGSVFLALDTMLDRQVAIKVLKNNSIQKNVRVNQTIQEARAVSRLQQANIIPLYEVGEHKNIPY